MEIYEDIYQTPAWDEDLKEEFGEAFDIELQEADQFFKENTEEFDFDLEDPYGDGF